MVHLHHWVLQAEEGGLKDQKVEAERLYWVMNPWLTFVGPSRPV